MSNSIDFHQIKQVEMILPASRPIVFINGQLCGFLVVAKIVRASYPEFSWAEIIYNAVGMENASDVPPEAIENIVPMSSKVTICQYYDSGIGNSRPSPYVIFAGYVEQFETSINEKRTEVKIKARDISAKLERVIVSGKRIATENSSITLNNDDVIFNSNEIGNRSRAMVNHNGRSYYAFGSEERQSGAFSYAEAIYYLLCEYVLCGLAQLPDLKQIESIVGDIAISHVSVDGLNVISAINKCCQQIGLDFKFSPRQSRTGPDVGFVLYRPDKGRCVELNRQYDGEVFNISKTTVHELTSKRKCWPMTQKYIGLGDVKIFESTFGLVKAWDPAGEGSGQSSYAVTSNNFEQVKDVYRKWCLNEAGDYSNAPFNAGQPFDFSTIFETENYVKRRRLFLDCITSDTEGDSIGKHLEISYDSGNTWQQFTGNFDVLADECGVWISDESLDNDLWAAAQAGGLTFRITAAVESDERLTYSVANGPVNSSVEVIDNFVSLPGDHCFRKVNGKSIFHKNNSTDIGIPDEVDDSEKLVAHLIRQANAEPNIIESIEVTTPMVSCNFEHGDMVTCSPASRDILGVRRDPRSLFWIERVEMDFVEQRTKLKILRGRKQPV